MAYSFSSRCARGRVTRSRKAVEHAVDPNSALFTPLTAMAPPLPTWYCTADWPVRYTALPLTLMQVNVELPWPGANRAPMRPPQPVRAPSGSDDCQYDCWSLCEKSLGGRRTERAEYCALVVGCTSVP